MANLSIPNQPKKLFLLIILVAVLSLVFHIHLGYYELFVEEARRPLIAENSDPATRLIGDVKVLGRSLNEHTTEAHRRMNGNFTRLLQRLQQVRLNLCLII